MDQTKEIIKDGKSSPENLALKILGKRCQDECRNLGIDLFYKENGQREIEYNLDSVYTYLSKLSFQNIGSYGVSIVAFQIYFEANNIDIGKIDGIEGPKFISGIKKYQIQNNLPQTGRLDTKTVATIKNDIKEKQKTMICSNEKPTTQNNSFTEEKNNSTTNPETINQTCEYKVTTIRNQYNQNFDNEIRKICDWCREDKGNYFLKFSLTLEDPEGKLKDVHVKTIQTTENDDYKISFIDDTTQEEHTDSLRHLTKNIIGFEISSKKELPKLESFNDNEIYDHKQPFFYTDDLS